MEEQIKRGRGRPKGATIKEHSFRNVDKTFYRGVITRHKILLDNLCKTLQTFTEQIEDATKETTSALVYFRRDRNGNYMLYKANRQINDLRTELTNVVNTLERIVKEG